MSTISYFEVVPSGIDMLTVTSLKVCVQVYLSVVPPFPAFGFSPLYFFSSSFPSGLASFLLSSSPTSVAEVLRAATSAAAGFSLRAFSYASIRAASSSVISETC
jgi:hypothetical protein